MKNRIIAAGLLMCAGCSDSMPKEQVLDRLRVLALTTPTPEVLPGATVTLTPLVTDYLGAGRALTYTVEACTDPGLAYGASPDCSHDSAKQTVASTSIALAAPRYTGTATPFSITVPADLFTTQKTSALEQYNGANYLVILTITAADGEIEKTYRRIKVSSSTKTPKNTNPSLTSIQNSSGTTLSAFPSSTTSLLAVPASGSEETYSEMSTLGTTSTRTESLVVSWFSTEDGFETARLGVSTSNSLSVPTSLSTSPFLIAVIRDERGGVGYLQLNR